MENAPIQNSSDNASAKDDYVPGRFLDRLHTFAALVLAELLDGKELIGRDMEYSNTVRHAVQTLEHGYGWRIDTRYFVIDVYGGRPARFAAYSLSPELIARANENGADAWRRVVKLVHDIMAESRQYCGYHRRSKYGEVYPAGVDVLMALRKQLLRRKG
jgi:hypothetical protein